MRRAPIDRRTVMVSSLMAGTAAVLGGFVPTVVVGASLPRAPETPEAPGTETARFADGTIRYQQAGDGDHAVVLLHGFNGHLGHWDAVWRELVQGPHRAIRLDLPGFGASAWRTPAFGVREQAERVVALLDRLGVGAATLVGTSMGGSVAVALAAEHPSRVRGVVLVAPSGYPGSLVQPGLFGRLARPGRLNRAATVVARGRLFRRLYPDSRAVQALTVTASYGDGWAALLARIRAPTLLVWGRADATTPFAFAAPVQRAIAGSALVALDASTGHMVPAQRPQVLARGIELLAAGQAPEAVASALSYGTLRPGEGPAAG